MTTSIFNKILNKFAKWLLIKTCSHYYKWSWTDDDVLLYEIQPHYDSYEVGICVKCKKRIYDSTT